MTEIKPRFAKQALYNVRSPIEFIVICFRKAVKKHAVGHMPLIEKTACLVFCLSADTQNEPGKQHCTTPFVIDNS